MHRARAATGDLVQRPEAQAARGKLRIQRLDPKGERAGPRIMRPLYGRDLRPQHLERGSYPCYRSHDANQPARQAGVLYSFASREESMESYIGLEMTALF